MRAIIATVLVALAAPAMAQTAPAASGAAPAAGSFSVESTSIEALAADPRAKAVLDKELPELLAHPAYDQFKVMTLSQLAPMSQGSITEEKLAAIQAEFAKIK
jgi:hypothetical protein